MDSATKFKEYHSYQLQKDRHTEPGNDEALSHSTVMIERFASGALQLPLG